MTTTPSTITTITNPVLTGMYPDPTWMWDADNNRIAMVNSSFELVPGLPIHVSDDLGRWTHLADAIDEAMARACSSRSSRIPAACTRRRCARSAAST